MPRDVSLSDSKCWNGGQKWVTNTFSVRLIFLWDASTSWKLFMNQYSLILLKCVFINPNEYLWWNILYIFDSWKTLFWMQLIYFFSSLSTHSFSIGPSKCYLQTADKLEGSFSRSRSSSISSLENIGNETIQCLAFAESYVKKNGELCSTLWKFCLWHY